MDAFLIIIGAATVYLLWFIFGKKTKNEDLSNNMPPLPRGRTVVVARARRRRLSGGFYPIGYAGSYLPGEDLVEELLWMAELAAMTELERNELGEYGGEEEYQVEDPRESSGEFDEPEVVEEIPAPAKEAPEPAEEAPEAEEFVALDPEPTPAPEPEPAPAPTPEPEEDKNRGGWGGDDDGSGDFSDIGSDDSDSGGSWDDD